MTSNGKATLFGRRLRGWRIDNDLTQVELSERLGIRQGTLSDWELGNRMPRGEMLRGVLDMIGADQDVRASVFEEAASR